MSEEALKVVLPVAGDIVEVYGPHRGWVRTARIASVVTENDVPVGFQVAHPDADTVGISIRYENGKTPWRWPVTESTVDLCLNCIGNMLKERVCGGQLPVVTSHRRGVLTCAHKNPS